MAGKTCCWPLLPGAMPLKPAALHIPGHAVSRHSAEYTAAASADGAVCSRTGLDTDEQMVMMRRSVDGGRSFGGMLYPYMQPVGSSAWPFPKNLKTYGQPVWDSARQRVWLFHGASQAHDGVGHGCVGDGQQPLGVLLSYSTDFGLSWAKPFNLSAAITPQWPSLCIAPAGGNSALDLGGGKLLFMANVVGSIPGVKTGELYIQASGSGLTPETLQFDVSRDMLRQCSDPATGHLCNFDEAAMAAIKLPSASAAPASVACAGGGEESHRRCGGARRASMGNCLVCMAQYFGGGGEANCTAAQREAFCAGGADATTGGTGGTGGTAADAAHVFVTLRSDPALTHQYATALSTDGYYSHRN